MVVRQVSLRLAYGVCWNRHGARKMGLNTHFWVQTPLVCMCMYPRGLDGLSSSGSDIDQDAIWTDAFRQHVPHRKFCQ
jgi:hypothetical protein